MKLREKSNKTHNYDYDSNNLTLLLLLFKLEHCFKFCEGTCSQNKISLTLRSMKYGKLSLGCKSFNAERKTVITVFQNVDGNRLLDSTLFKIYKK